MRNMCRLGSFRGGLTVRAACPDSCRGRAAEKSSVSSNALQPEDEMPVTPDELDLQGEVVPLE